MLARGGHRPPRLKLLRLSLPVCGAGVTQFRGAGDGTPSPCVPLSWPLGTLGVFFHLIVPHLYPHFTDEETEAPRGKQLPGVPRLARGEVAFLRWLSLESPVLDTHVTQHEALNPSASRNEHVSYPRGARSESHSLQPPRMPPSPIPVLVGPSGLGILTAVVADRVMAPKGVPV